MSNRMQIVLTLFFAITAVALIALVFADAGVLRVVAALWLSGVITVCAMIPLGAIFEGKQ